MNLSKVSLFLVISLVCVATAMASTTCPNGPYSGYAPGAIDVGTGSITCTTENLQFSLFGFASGGTNPITAAGVGVTVLDPGADGPGFSFDPAISLGPNQSSDASISFVVTALNGTSINDLFIGFNGSGNGSFSTTYSEVYCTGGWNSGCNSFQVNNPPPDLTKLITIPSTTTLYITKDFGASAGNGSSASISLVTNQFSSPVPEPREIGLLILAMVGLVFAHRRFKTSVN